jgi:hypothetical protein
MSGRTPMSDDERWRLLTACVAASCLVPVCAGLLLFLLALASGSVAIAFVGAPLLLAVAIAVAGAHVMLLGLPLYLLARAWGPVDWPAAAVAGILIGALPVQLMLVQGGEERIRAALLFGAFGLVSALAFWRTATRA